MRGWFLPDPRRFVRPSAAPRTKRFSVDELEADWLVNEASDPTPYGIPRFDGIGDVFVP